MMDFVYEIFFSYSLRSFACLKSYDFTSPPKEGVLRIFIALKNPSSLQGLNPTNTGSGDKHTDHYTTEETG
jgi:hypothetical protein